MSRLLFTGERLHEGSALFGVDLARHRAAYVHAIERAKGEGCTRLLELGCGTGYGTAQLADSLEWVVAVDRISPDPEARHERVQFIRADLNGIPLTPASFDMVVSFQVIEHLDDPSIYLEAISRALRPGGVALLTTPNLLTSDCENPFHVHEYTASELESCLSPYFEEVEMLGITATPETMVYFDERLRRIKSIMRVDPFGLRHKMPRGLIDWLFARFAIIVRRGIQQKDGLPDASVDDFPVVAGDERCLDLFAVCRRPTDAGPSPETTGPDPR